MNEHKTVAAKKERIGALRFRRNIYIYIYIHTHTRVQLSYFRWFKINSWNFINVLNQTRDVTNLKSCQPMGKEARRGMVWKAALNWLRELYCLFWLVGDRGVLWVGECHCLIAFKMTQIAYGDIKMLRSYIYGHPCSGKYTHKAQHMNIMWQNTKMNKIIILQKWSCTTLNSSNIWFTLALNSNY